MKYADTNIQLYQQLLNLGYTAEDVSRVYEAYEFTATIFTCIYHRCGDSFINHLVRTSSIFASLNAETDLVVAALVHSAYLHGNFGTLQKGMTEFKRKEVRSVIGRQAEDYVARFTNLDWSPSVIPDIARKLPQLQEPDRKIVLMRLINELEEFLDYGIFYCSNAPLRVEGARVLGPTLSRMAVDLGYPVLASELTRVFSEARNGNIPHFLRHEKEITYTMDPRKLSPDRLPLLQDGAIRQIQRVRSAIRLRTRIRKFLANRRAAPAVHHAFAEMDHGVVMDNALLAGKNVLITGAGPKIGRSIAIEMMKQGANVYFTDLMEQQCKDLEQELMKLGGNGRVKWFAADISKIEEVKTLHNWLNSSSTDIHIFVNNVGIAWAKRGIRNFSISEWEKVFQTNLFGPLYLTHLVTEDMIRRKITGSILFLSSVHQWTIYGEPSYSTSKAALGMAIKELALELAPHGIRVNGIAPGWAEEDENGNAIPFPRHQLWGVSIHPCYIGRAAVYLCSDYFSKFTTGTVLQIDSGLTLFNPQEGLWKKES